MNIKYRIQTLERNNRLLLLGLLATIGLAVFVGASESEGVLSRLDKQKKLIDSLNKQYNQELRALKQKLSNQEKAQSNLLPRSPDWELDWQKVEKGKPYQLNHNFDHEIAIAQIWVASDETGKDAVLLDSNILRESGNGNRIYKYGALLQKSDQNDWQLTIGDAGLLYATDRTFKYVKVLLWKQQK